MLTSPPSYPLSQKEFRRAVAAGLGRAWIQAVQHGAAPYRAAILDAATHCRIYDPQCEGLRGAWLADLCQSAGVVDKVLAARVPTESWDRDQRSDLLEELHRRGVAVSNLEPSPADEEEGDAPDDEPRAVRERETVEQVLESIRSSTASHYGLGFWGRKASPGELAAVLGLLLAETNPRTLENALRCLAGSESPPLDARVFELTTHPDATVRDFAALTLGRHQSVEVGNFARATIERGELELGVRILRRSATPADGSLLLAHLSPVADREELHERVFGLTQLLESSPALRSAELALYCYDRSPCSNCRGSAVALLDRWGERPAWVTKELAHDADVERYGES